MLFLCLLLCWDLGVGNHAEGEENVLFFPVSLGTAVGKGPFFPSLRSLVMEGWLPLFPKCIWCPQGMSGFD